MINQPKPAMRPAAPAPKPAMTVKFFLKHGAVVDWPVPASHQAFSLPAFVASIRASGYFVHDDLYVPGDEIACIGVGSSAKVIHPASGVMQ